MLLPLGLWAWIGFTNSSHGISPQKLWSRSLVAADQEPPLAVSPDGTCGPGRGFTCAGSANGPCCSEHFFCGSDDDYCGKGCLLEFGHCDMPSQPSCPAGTTRTATERITLTSGSTATSTRVVTSFSLRTLTSYVTIPVSSAALYFCTVMSSPVSRCRQR